MTHSNFYRQFEDRHRGSRTLIKDRLAIYLDFIQPLKALDDSCSALDLGCGRGEWLEVLRDAGILARGVDTDPGMLAACESLGLRAIQEDALSALRALDATSLHVITAFHLVEHLAFEDLLTLVEEAHRTLKPGGLLILETPNPENLWVAGHSFYVDPTHIKPIPPVLLDFSTEFSGFKRSRILRLQESKELGHAITPGFWDVIAGGSPDYAVIAQKDGPKGWLQCIDGPFQRERGVTGDQIAKAFDQSLAIRFDQMRQDLGALDQRGARTDRYLQSVEPRFKHLREDLDEIFGRTSRIDHYLEGVDPRLSSLQMNLDEISGRTSRIDHYLEGIEPKFEALQGEIEQSRQMHALETRLAVAETRLEERERRFEETQEAFAGLKIRHHALEEKSATLEKWAQNLERERLRQGDYIHHLEARMAALSLTAQEQMAEAQRLLVSTSWKITAPLRGLSRLLRWAVRLLRRLALSCLMLLLLVALIPFYPFIILALPWILRRPWWRDKLSFALSNHAPLLYRILQWIAVFLGLVSPAADQSIKPTPLAVESPSMDEMTTPAPTPIGIAESEEVERHLSPNAKQQLRKLQRAMRK